MSQSISRPKLRPSLLDQAGYAVLVVLSLWMAAPVHAESRARFLVPSGVFTQAGFGENHTNAYVVGAIWDWNWSRTYSFGRLTGYADAAVGRWSTDADGYQGSTWATQIGLTPVLRLQSAHASRPWFMEIGVGANFILPLYRNDEKRFSTEFNFGDHIGVGYWFDTAHRHELMVRVQHFSNGGIDHPNPGENFVQLRYSYRYVL